MGDLDWYDAFQGIPAVIHYTSHNKPWTSNASIVFGTMVVLLCSLSGKFLLETDFEANLSRPSGRISLSCRHLYPHTADIHELETLLKELPDVAIHVLPIAILVS